MCSAAMRGSQPNLLAIANVGIKHTQNTTQTTVAKIDSSAKGYRQIGPVTRRNIHTAAVSDVYTCTRGSLDSRALDPRSRVQSAHKAAKGCTQTQSMHGALCLSTWVQKKVQAGALAASLTHVNSKQPESMSDNTNTPRSVHPWQDSNAGQLDWCC
jgi:hypothetical protein